MGHFLEIARLVESQETAYNQVIIVPPDARKGRKSSENFTSLQVSLIAEAFDGIMPSLRPTLKPQETADQAAGLCVFAVRHFLRTRTSKADMR